MLVSQLSPQLRTTDLTRAIDFYTNTLGFSLEFIYEDFYAGIRSGDFSLHLKRVDERDPGIPFVKRGDHLHLWIEVDALERLFDELSGKHVNILSPPTDKPWGRREMIVEDPDGHIIYFAGK